MSKRGNADLTHQKQEIEILESIYMDEIDFHNPVPPFKFSVQCRPYLDFSLNEALERFAVQLEIELSNQYPQESPKCEIKHHVDKISNSHIQQVQKLISRTAEELKGTPMLFEIIESIRGWLQNNIVDPELRPKKLKRKNADEEEGDDENEGGEIVVNLTKKETYTIVTRESFIEWKKAFDLEIETMKRLKGELGAGKEEKLTGKQLFERDMKLISSDLVDKDDDDVEVDYDYGKEEAKEPEEEEEEDSERTRQLFCYNEELFEGGDIDDLDDS